MNSYYKRKTKKKQSKRKTKGKGKATRTRRKTNLFSLDAFSLRRGRSLKYKTLFRSSGNKYRKKK